MKSFAAVTIVKVHLMVPFIKYHLASWSLLLIDWIFFVTSMRLTPTGLREKTFLMFF
jgi:hypothetical protein